VYCTYICTSNCQTVLVCVIVLGCVRALRLKFNYLCPFLLPPKKQKKLARAKQTFCQHKKKILVIFSVYVCEPYIW